MRHATLVIGFRAAVESRPAQHDLLLGSTMAGSAPILASR
jgi:hypothetical protein